MSEVALYIASYRMTAPTQLDHIDWGLTGGEPSASKLYVNPTNCISENPTNCIYVNPATCISMHKFQLRKSVCV